MKEIISKKELYTIALETRNFEIQLFWQRSYYFLALNSGIALAFFKVNLSYQFLFGIFGLCASTLWLFINLGTKFWQERWETRLRIAENNLQLTYKINYFDADWQIILADVKDGLNYSNHSLMRKCIDFLILKKPSVSFIMILLSLSFIALWCIIIIKV